MTDEDAALHAGRRICSGAGGVTMKITDEMRKAARAAYDKSMAGGWIACELALEAALAVSPAADMLAALKVASRWFDIYGYKWADACKTVDAAIAKAECRTESTDPLHSATPPGTEPIDRDWFR